MAILTFVYAVATIFILKANRSAVKESRLAREAEARPYVVAYLQVNNNGVMNFVLKNTGKTVAKNVELSFDKEIDFPESRPLKENYVVKNGLKTMPPDYQLEHFLGMGFRLNKDEENNYPTYNIEISYDGIIGKKRYTETHTLDFNILVGSLAVRELEMNDLVKEVKQIREKLSH